MPFLKPVWTIYYLYNFISMYENLLMKDRLYFYFSFN